MKHLKYNLFLLLIPACLLFLPARSSAQDTVVKNGYQKFVYKSGVISSEGSMRDGKPDG